MVQQHERRNNHNNNNNNNNSSKNNTTQTTSTGSSSLHHRHTINSHNSHNNTYSNNPSLVSYGSCGTTCCGIPVLLLSNHYCDTKTSSNSSNEEMSNNRPEIQQRPVVVITATTGTTTIGTNSNTSTNSNTQHEHHHRRNSTNTDIASLFQNSVLPILFGKGRTVPTIPTAITSQSQEHNADNNNNHHGNEEEDDDDEDDHYPPLILPTTTSRDTTIATRITNCCGCCCSGGSSSRNHRNRHRIPQSRSNVQRSSSSSSSNSMMIPMTGAILNLCNATLGAGILALPYTLLQSGFIAGILLLGIAAIGTERSVYILTSVLQQYHQYNHYPTTTTTTNSNSNSNTNTSTSTNSTIDPITITNATTYITPTTHGYCSYESLTEDVLDKPQQSIGLVESSATTTTTTTTTTGSTKVVRFISYRTTIEISMLLFCCGCAVGYIIAIGDILQEFHLLFVYNNRAYTTIVVWCIAMVPLSLLHNVQSLQYASAIGITAIGILIVAAYVHYLQQHHYSHHHDHHYNNTQYAMTTTTTPTATGTKPPSSNDYDEDVVSMMDFLWPTNGWVSILTSGPVVLFAFSCQPNVCSIYDELTVDHSDDDENDEYATTTTTTTTTAAVTASTKKLQLMHRVTITAVCICALLYCSISVIALADFGNHVQPNMLSCYTDHSSHLIQFATAAMALAIVMAFPLNIFPARVTLIGLWENYCRRREQQQQQSRIDVDGSISLHGITRPHSGLTAALLDEEEIDERLPPNVHNGNGSSDRYLNQSLLGGESLNDTNGNLKNKTLQPPHDDHEIMNNGTVGDPPFNRTVHIVSTLFLTTLTLVLALILPNISVVFGLLGGTASSWLGFCVPGLLGIQLSKNERAMGQPTRYSMIITSWSLLIGGVIVGVLTTGVTIYNTMAPPKVP